MTTPIKLVELPGTELRKGHSLQLHGEPNSKGRYTGRNLTWHHLAHRPLGKARELGIERGDPCSTDLDDFWFYPLKEDDGGGGYGLRQTHFESIEQIIEQMNISPSISCPLCGRHVYIGARYPKKVSDLSRGEF